MNQHERAIAQEWAVKVQELEAEIERLNAMIKELRNALQGVYQIALAVVEHKR